MSKLQFIEIGEWDMDSEDKKVVSHNIPEILDLKVDIGVMIKNDEEDICYGAVIDDKAMPEGVIVCGITEKHITVMRSQCGRFDSSNFDDISINRGYIKIATQ